MITKEIIQQEYIARKKNCSQIAREFHVSPKTIQNYIRKFGFEVRKCSGVKKKDLVGMVFGCYTVIRYDSKGRFQHRWLCRCKCGHERIMNGQSLTQSKATSCGKCKYSCKFTGIGELSGTYVKNIKRRSAREKNGV